jgi:hypothetical protein
MKIIVTEKLTVKEAFESIPKIEEWFKQNPTRKVCQTDYFKVRRGFVGTDILKHTYQGLIR